MSRTWPFLLLTAGALAARFATAPTAPDAADSIYFLRGLSRYSVVELRPHWPGYPVYLWCGRLAQAALGDPVAALHALSMVASTLALWPLAGLASAWRRAGGAGETAARLSGFGAALVWTVTPGSWVTGSQIFSDPLGLLLALAVLWLSWTAAAGGGGGWRLPAAAFLAGLMLGTRLVYGVMLAPLALATWWRRRGRVAGRVPIAVAVPAVLAAGVAPWLTWQISKDGARWIAAAAETLSGHFSSWGESAVTDAGPVSRPARLLATTLVYGIGGWAPGLSGWRIPVTVAFTTLAAAGAVRLVRAPNRARLVAASWIFPYLVWMVLAQDVDYPRHALPLVAVGCVLTGLGVPARPVPGLAALAVAAGTTAAVTVPVASAQRVNPPLEHQLAQYLAAHAPPAAALILADDLRPALVFLRETAPGVAVEVAPLPAFGRRAAVLARSGQAVYATAPALEDPQEWVVAARFCRDPALDPRVARELWLFRLEPGASPEPLPACGFREAADRRAE